MTTPAETTNGDDLPPWKDLDAKKEIFGTIIGRILTHYATGEEYVRDPEKAREDIKKLINVPDDVKIVFLRAGDSNREGGGSVVIELPPPETTSMTAEEKFELFHCTYNPW